METEPYQQFQWLQFAPELPSFGEFTVIVLYTVGLILVGKLLKSWWERDNETVPIPVAIGMGAGMLAMFFLLVYVFYHRTADSHQTDSVVLYDGREMATFEPGGDYMGILVWCMIALVFPLFYYGLIIVNAFTSRVIDRVSPFGMQIHEPSEFAEARKMALRGDLDGAVKRYRAYLENTEDALFEAARLLRAEDRFAEAASLFLEISERFYGKKVIWAEAVYQLAKLRESNLHQAGEAMDLLRQVIERTPESRFGQLAKTDLVRMGALYGSETEAEPEVEAEASNAATNDPFYVDKSAAPTSESATENPTSVVSTPDNSQENADEEGSGEDAPLPPVDPFYAASQRNREDPEDAEE
jgi:hypothetical protein